MHKDFWVGKRVFLTGHSGFKGGWLTLWLQSLGAEVTGLSLSPETTPNLFTRAQVDHGIASVFGDIRDPVLVRRAMSDAHPEIVIHMAAQPLVRYSYANPLETCATNVMGTVHVLEAVRKTPGVKAAVVVSSDKCYENHEWVWGYREDDRLGGHDPYSNSKACTELVTSSYRQAYFPSTGYATHGVALASARAGNVIGGGDWSEDRLIPDVIRAMERAQSVVIRNQRAIRPWQHVLEPLSGYLLLAERLYTEGSCYAEAWNFGPHDTDARPVRWIVERLTARWASGATWTPDQNPQPHEAQMLKLDCSKARDRLGWQPRWSLSMTIDRVVDWYRAAQSRQDMREFTLGQIEAYQTGASAYA
jgi:CDP-glucose 4,6-dehydratase